MVANRILMFIAKVLVKIPQIVFQYIILFNVCQSFEFLFVKSRTNITTDPMSALSIGLNQNHTLVRVPYFTSTHFLLTDKHRKIKRKF